MCSSSGGQNCITQPLVSSHLYDDEHMCSKHVEAWNKLIVKQKVCASSWLITEINILRRTVCKTPKFIVLFVFFIIIILCGCYLLTKETNPLTYYNYSLNLSKKLSPFMKLHISLLSQKKQNLDLIPNQAKPVLTQEQDVMVLSVQWWLQVGWLCSIPDRG